MDYVLKHLLTKEPMIILKGVDRKNVGMFTIQIPT